LTTLRNCVLQYKCPNNWDNLKETEAEDIRFCGECQKEVHFCYGDDDLAKNIRLNRCIAFFDAVMITTMGIPELLNPQDFYIKEIVGMGLEQRYLNDLDFEDIKLIWELLQKSVPEDILE
jgi:hypothetical protein